MRKPHSNQRRLDCQTVESVKLNLDCRDEIIPVLHGLQFIYSQKDLLNELLQLIGNDINQDSRSDVGREGMEYWQILVLAAVRQGCNLDYDKLQDLAENHRALRHIMGIGDWKEDITFNARCIGDNVRGLKTETIEQISLRICQAGHTVAPEAAQQVRVDSFVVDTNIHYPTESSLIYDGIRKITELCVMLSAVLGVPGWRQHEQLLRKARKVTREIHRISARKGANYKSRLKKQYQHLLKQSRRIVHRANELCETADCQGGVHPTVLGSVAQIREYIELTEQVRNTARRRVVHGETVANEDKLFSIFEPHTQLYKRGKAGEPIQFGRLVLVCEDAAGFIVHHSVMARDAQDRDVAVAETHVLQDRLDHQVEGISFDRGFHSPENQEELIKIVTNVCLPIPGKKQTESDMQMSKRFQEARQRHPGIESAIGALQRGNGLERCRDRTEEGFKRYVALAILGRNLQNLGKLLIAQENAGTQACHTLRAAA